MTSVNLGNIGHTYRRYRIGLVGVGNMLDWSHCTSWDFWICHNPSFSQVWRELPGFSGWRGSRGSGWNSGWRERQNDGTIIPWFYLICCTSLLVSCYMICGNSLVANIVMLVV